jgi:hypothetical protein
MLLRSPLHRVLSGSTDVIRYTGRHSGRMITTPTQYARHGDGIVILVGKSEEKSWWRNFHDEERRIDVLLEGGWVTMSARAIVGAEEPEAAAPLLDAYLARFPRARRLLGDGAREEKVRRAVLVSCRAL